MQKLKFPKAILNSQNGSAIILALTAVALLGLMAGAAMTVSGLLANEAQKKVQQAAVSQFASILETAVTNQAICSGTGAPVPPPMRLAGLKFTSTNSKVCDHTCINSGANTGKINVSVEINIQNDQNNRIAVAGRSFPSAGVKVDQLYLTNVTHTPDYATAFGTLMASLSTTGPVAAFAPREIGQVTMNFASANIVGTTMLSCNAAPSAQMLCREMQCVYDATAVQKCSCGYPDMSCPTGQYISGFDPQTQRPVCKSASLDCSVTKGPGYFFAGVDDSGQPICLAVEGAIGNPPPPAAQASNCVYQSGYFVTDYKKSNKFQFIVDLLAGKLVPDAHACTVAMSAACDRVFSNVAIGEPCTTDGEILDQGMESLCVQMQTAPHCRVVCVCNQPAATPTPTPTPTPAQTVACYEKDLAFGVSPQCDTNMNFFADRTSCQNAHSSGSCQRLDGPCVAVQAGTPMADNCAVQPAPQCSGNPPAADAECCSGAWAAHPAVQGQEQYQFCGCGNSPVWTKIRSATGQPTQNGC